MSEQTTCHGWRGRDCMMVSTSAAEKPQIDTFLSSDFWKALKAIAEAPACDDGWTEDVDENDGWNVAGCGLAIGEVIEYKPAREYNGEYIDPELGGMFAITEAGLSLYLIVRGYIALRNRDATIANTLSASALLQCVPFDDYVATLIQKEATA